MTQFQTQENGKYLPPHLRAQKMAQNAVDSEELARLKKQLKGLINRLAESNMHSIANQVQYTLVYILLIYVQPK